LGLVLCLLADAACQICLTIDKDSNSDGAADDDDDDGGGGDMFAL